MNFGDWLLQIVGFSVLAAIGAMSATREPVGYSVGWEAHPTQAFSVDSSTQVEQIPCATADGKQGVLSVLPYWDDSQEPVIMCREQLEVRN